MKYIRGFLMAWGMFCWVPCPYKQWHEEDRKAMIAMFPLVGTCIGVIVCLIWWALDVAGIGQFVSAAILTGAYFLLTGFIHLDGFMDCSDATLPRHAEMDTRIRILKDSHSGAFALICLCLMLVIFTGSMMEIVPEFSAKACTLMVLIFTTSRFMSGMYVLTCEPMKTSQYANDSEKTGRVVDVIPAFIILIIVLGAAELILSDGRPSALIAELYSNIVAVVVILAAAITGNLDRKMLGGMNGDISGHMITTSEMFGIMALAIMC